MKHMLWIMGMGWWLALGTVWAGQGSATTASTEGGSDMVQESEQSMVLILVGNGGGRVQSVSAGVIIRSDGIVLAAYHPLKGAQEMQVRLRDGEVYDHVTLVGFDERRDVAALHIPANGLVPLSRATLEEATTGEKIHVLNVDGRMAWSSPDGVLGPIRLADEILGAGHGYRVIQFMAPLPLTSLGGALLDSRGQLLGIITGSPKTNGQQYAVPVESVAGLPAQALYQALGTGRNLTLPATSFNQGTVADEETSPMTALTKARTLRVTSKTVYFTPFMLEKELLDNTEFRALGINVLEGSRGGELLVIVDRPVFTYDFTYFVMDPNAGIILATGKVTAIDGPHAAQGIAKGLVQKLEKAQAAQEPQSQQEAVSAQQ